MLAVDAMQAEARRKGADKISASEIDAEIQAVRKRRA